MNQSKSWKVIVNSMIWADREGNIGWHETYDEMGDGRYEWVDYLPIIEKPNIFNPEEDFFATANQNVTPISMIKCN